MNYGKIRYCSQWSKPLAVEEVLDPRLKSPNQLFRFRMSRAKRKEWQFGVFNQSYR